MTKHLPSFLLIVPALILMVGCAPQAVVSAPMRNSVQSSSSTTNSSSTNASSGTMQSSSNPSSSSTGTIKLSSQSAGSIIPLRVDSVWVMASVGASDTITFQMNTTPGKAIAIQVDDYLDGTDTYTGDVTTQAYHEDGSNVWVREQDDGYLPMQITPTGTSVTVRIHAYSATYAGSFAIRATYASATPFAGKTLIPQALATNASGAYQPYSLLNDTLYYQVAVDSGKSYTVTWQDASDEATAKVYSLDVAVAAFQANGDLVWKEDDAYTLGGYTIHTAGKTIFLRVVPYDNLVISGTFALLVFPNP